MNTATSVTSPAARPAGMRLGGMAAAAAGCMLLALLGGALCFGWLVATGGDAGLVAALVCAGPLLVSTALAFTSRSDRRQYVVRLMAAAVMLPMLLMMWATTEETGAGQWTRALSAFGFIVLHIAAVATLVWHLAWLTTRIEATPGSPVSADQLGQRLQSLLGDHMHWQMASGDVRHEWVIDSTPQGDAARLYRVLLNIDPLRCEVQVRERQGLSGAAPRNADEASLRTIGDEIVDAARPQAQRIWSRQFMATIIDPVHVDAVPLQTIGGHAQFAGRIGTDSDGLLTLLAALVTRSGYAWQPVMKLRGA